MHNAFPEEEEEGDGGLVTLVKINNRYRVTAGKELLDVTFANTLRLASGVCATAQLQRTAGLHFNLGVMPVNSGTCHHCQGLTSSVRAEEQL